MLLAATSCISGMMMGVGSTSYVVKVTFYIDGFVGAGSNKDAIAPTIGTLSSPNALGAVVKALYWEGTGGHAGTGTVNIELSGNRSAGFLSSVKVNGTSLGAIGSPTFNSTENTTKFPVGGTVSNPFGTSGTLRISIT